jgi:putative PIN family toxin of toxin-antitoxin system
VRVLLDTNVLASAILFGGIPRTLLERGIRGELDLVTSPALMGELEELLGRKFGFPPDAARQVRSELELVADVVRPRSVPQILRDPDDDQVLAAADEGAAQAIITGDRDLLELGSHGDVQILSPRDFLNLAG